MDEVANKLQQGKQHMAACCRAVAERYMNQRGASEHQPIRQVMMSGCRSQWLQEQVVFAIADNQLSERYTQWLLDEAPLNFYLYPTSSIAYLTSQVDQN